MSTMLERLDAEVKATVDTIGGFGPIEMGAIKVFYPFIIRRLAADEPKAIDAFKELVRSLARVGDFTLPSLIVDADLVAEAKTRGLWPPDDVEDEPQGPSYPLDYAVKAGDTMTAIAAAFRVHLATLEAANPGAGHPAGNFGMLYIGDHLKIPAPEF
jgi:hypothetical protein